MALLRKNLTKKLQNIMRNTLTIILAPDGYGKTSYLKQFLKKGNIQNVWIEGKKDDCEQDVRLGIKNVLKNYEIDFDFFKDTSVLSMPDKLMKCIKEWDLCLQQDLVIVIDDFHKVHIPEINSFFVTAAQAETKFLHFVMIAPYLSDMQLTKIYDEKNCYTMSLQDFKIDYLELTKILKIKEIIINGEEIEELLEYTKGWAPAIELSMKAYLSGGSLFDTSQLEELLNRGKFDDIEEKDIVSLITLSLLPHFSLEQIDYVCNDVHIGEVIIELAHSQLFVQKPRPDEFSFSPIFRSYLKEALPRYHIQKKEVYQRMANWYIERDDYLGAIEMLMEGGAFDEIIQILSEADFSYVDIAPDLMQEVFHRMPASYRYHAPYIYLAYISDIMTNVDPYMGMKLLEEYKLDLIEGKYDGDKERLMGEYYYVHAFSGFNDVKCMMSDFHKAFDCFQGNPSQIAYPGMIASFGSYQLLYLYHHTPGKLFELFETIKQEAKYFVQISHGCNAGSECQVEAEYLYITGEFQEVESYARAAFQIAYLNRQTSICICASFQLGRLALMKENQSLYQSVLNDLLEIQKCCTIPILQKEVDCALAYLYILNEKEDNVAQWIIEGDIHASELMHEAEGLPYLINMLYQLKKKNYVEAQGCCKMIEYGNQRVVHALALLYALMGQAIIFFHTNKKEEAYTCLKKLLETARKDHIISIFLEFSCELYPLFIKYKVENEFEKEVSLKIKRRYKQNENDHNNVYKNLSDREKAVARLYIDSFTAKDIAIKLSISENTVLTHIKSIYTKLGVNKKKELIMLLDRRNQKR